MALEFAHGAIQALASNGVGTTYTVSGLAFQPKAIMFWWQGLASAADAASQATHLRRGVGFISTTGGVSGACVATYSQDAAAAMTCVSGNMQLVGYCVATIEPTGPAVDGALSPNAVNSDGFQLITSDALPVDLTIFWSAWGGSDIQASFWNLFTEPATATTQAIGHGVGGTPSVAIFAFVNASINTTAARNDSSLSVGFATGTTDAENVVVCGNNDDGSASADTDGYGRAAECIAAITTAGGNPNSRAKLTAWGATTITLTWNAVAGAATRGGLGLFIRGGNWKAGGTTINGNTGSATATVSGLTYAPVGVMAIGRMTTESAAGTSSAEDRMSIGCGSSTTSRRAMGAWDENGTGNTEIDHVIEYDEILAYPSNAGALATAHDLNAMNSDGFQLIVDTAGGVASEWIGYLTFGSSAVAYTLAVDSGSFSVTGTAATLKSARKVTAAAAAYTVTGTAAALKAGRKLVVDAGAFAWTGSAATFRRDLRATADIGAFSVTGTAAGLLYARRFAVDAGAFTWTGTAAALLKGFPLFVDAGAFTWTGTAATLRKDSKLALDAGAFTWTGTVATFRRDLRLTVDVGAFSVSGQAAALALMRRLTADVGAFTWTGTAAALTLSRRLVADAGAFTWTGTVATLRKDSILALDVGAFTWTGTAAGLLYARRFVVDAGAFTWTGTAAALRAARYLSAGAGVVTWTGQDAGLTVPGSFALAAESGSFVVTGTAARLLYAQRFQVDAGAFTWTGTAAALRVGRRLSVDAGGFTWTGTAATLTYTADYALAAGAGAFTWTGTPAALRVGYLLSAAPGAWTVNGIAAEFSRSLRLIAGFGAFVVTGSPVSFVWSGALVVTPDVIVRMRADVERVTMAADVERIVMTRDVEVRFP